MAAAAVLFRWGAAALDAVRRWGRAVALWAWGREVAPRPQGALPPEAGEAPAAEEAEPVRVFMAAGSLRELQRVLAQEEPPAPHFLSEVLLHACARGNDAVIRELLAQTGERAVDVHAQDEAPFLWACLEGHAHTVRLLLGLTGDRAVDVHARGEMALLYACHRGHADVVRLLLSLPAPRAVNARVGDSVALAVACGGGHAGVVRELLALGEGRAPDVNAQEDDVNALCEAAEGGHAAVVRALLQCPATDVHALGDRALVHAAQGGHADVLALLLQQREARAPRWKTAVRALWQAPGAAQLVPWVVAHAPSLAVLAGAARSLPVHTARLLRRTYGDDAWSRRHAAVAARVARVWTARRCRRRHASLQQLYERVSCGKARTVV